VGDAAGKEQLRRVVEGSINSVASGRLRWNRDPFGGRSRTSGLARESKRARRTLVHLVVVLKRQKPCVNSLA
jgi:hypothetical protein